MIDKKFCLSFQEDPGTVDFQGKMFHITASLAGESSSVLVLSIYRAEKELLFRHFIEKGKYLTYFSSGKKSTASLGYLNDFDICWTPYECDRKYSFGESFVGMVQWFLKQIDYQEAPRKKYPWFAVEMTAEEEALRLLEMYEEELLKEKLENRHKAIIERIDEKMKLVPEIPKGFEEWLKEELFKADRYICYDARKRKKLGKCSYCGHVAEYPDAKREQGGVCAGCGSKIVFFPGRQATDILKKASAVVLQKTEEGLLFRRFTANCRHPKNGEPFRTQEISYFETDRCFWGLEDGKYFTEDAYSYQDFKQTGKIRWCEWDREWDRNLYGRVYPKNLRESLNGSVYQYSALQEFVEHEQGTYEGFAPTRYLRAYEEHPELEYMVKRGFYSISESLVHSWNGELVYRLQLLSKAHQKLLRQEDGGIEFLTFLEGIEKRHLSMSEEEILRAREWADGDDRMIKILTHTTITKLSNYLEKQQNQAEEEVKRVQHGQKVHRTKGKHGIFQIYADYFDFCEELGKNVDHDFVLYPRNLIGAHDELVEEILAYREREKKKKIKEYDQIMKKQHRALLKKYEFEDGGLKIVVPRSRKELEQEGEAMRNCVGTYLERMAKGKCVVLFVRKTKEPEKPYIDIEISGEKIIQCRRKQNKDAIDEIQGFLDKFKAKRLIEGAK